MFFKLVRFDLRNGLAAEWKKFLTALIVFLGFFSLHYLRVTAENVYLQRTGEKGLPFTCADFILSVLGGMRRVGSGEGNMEIFPALWMFFFLLLLFDTLRYPARNLEGMGKTMLLLSRSRRMWWLSKCVWCCCYVWAYFLLLYASAFLMALCLGGEMTLQPSEYAPSMLDAGRHIKAPPWNMSPGLLLALHCRLWNGHAANGAEPVDTAGLCLCFFRCIAAGLCFSGCSRAGGKLCHAVSHPALRGGWFFFGAGIFWGLDADCPEPAGGLSPRGAHGYSKQRVKGELR